MHTLRCNKVTGFGCKLRLQICGYVVFLAKKAQNKGYCKTFPMKSENTTILMQVPSSMESTLIRFSKLWRKMTICLTQIRICFHLKGIHTHRVDWFKIWQRNLWLATAATASLIVFSCHLFLPPADLLFAYLNPIETSTHIPFLWSSVPISSL